MDKVVWLRYLLNNLQVSPEKVVGFSHKALPAPEHFLLARFFMHRVVYYHKTIYALEEACRQLLRRLCDHYPDEYGIPGDGETVQKVARSDDLHGFTDAFVDNIIRKSAKHKGDKEEDMVIRALAGAIQSRKAPSDAKVRITKVLPNPKSCAKRSARTALSVLPGVNWTCHRR